MTPALLRLTVGQGLALEPPFSRYHTNYMMHVPTSVDTITFTVTKDEADEFRGSKDLKNTFAYIQYIPLLKVNDISPHIPQRATETVDVDFAENADATRAILDFGVYNEDVDNLTRYKVDIYRI